MAGAVARLACLALALLLSTEAAKTPALPLPDFIGKGCLLNDPKLDECIVKKGAPALIKVAQGDTKYRVPRIDPLLLNEVVIGRGTAQIGLVLTCKSCLLRGLQNSKLVKAKADLKSPLKTLVLKLKLDNLSVEGKYDVKGKVLLLPVTGSGNANFNFTNTSYTLKFEFVSEKKSNGLNYIKIKSTALDFDIGHMTMKLENLFNGDKLLGDNMNLFLNENWKDIMEEVKPALVEALTKVMLEIFSNIADLVPFDNMFPKE